MAQASSVAGLCRLACRQQAPRLGQFSRVQRIGRQHQAANGRAFTSSRAQRSDELDGDDGEDYGPLKLKRLNKSIAESSTPKALRQLDELAKLKGQATLDQHIHEASRNLPGVSNEDKMLYEEVRQYEMPDKVNRNSLWYDEDDPESHTEEHDEFDEDDITSMAHGKLHEVREMRNYARLTVLEMPLLAKFAKPFEPPKDGQVLRWRYTTYMGESHPAEKKVVVQFAPDDLKLTPVQTDKLKKLVGARYNPETELVKMSCESFEHQAQNKRYLSDLVDDLVAAAKDPKDTFEDIPLDTRHHSFKNKPKFPREWLLTEERRLQLEQGRQRLALEDRERVEKGLLVHGQKLIDESLTKLMLEEQAKQEEEQKKVAELVAAPRGSARGAGRARR